MNSRVSGMVSGRGRETLDLLLSNTYCRSQQYLSRQLSQLHPQLTMPVFSGKHPCLQTTPGALSPSPWDLLAQKGTHVIISKFIFSHRFTECRTAFVETLFVPRRN
jgi:hypothetical protein